MGPTFSKILAPPLHCWRRRWQLPWMTSRVDRLRRVAYTCKPKIKGRSHFLFLRTKTARVVALQCVVQLALTPCRRQFSRILSLYSMYIIKLCCLTAMFYVYLACETVYCHRQLELTCDVWTALKTTCTLHPFVGHLCWTVYDRQTLIVR